MRGRTWALVLVILAIAAQAFITAATANAKILTIFGNQVGLIATSDLYACLIFAFLSLLALLALFVIVIKSRSEGAIDIDALADHQKDLAIARNQAYEEGYKSGAKASSARLSESIIEKAPSGAIKVSPIDPSKASN